jgi:hypothetical protein
MELVDKQRETAKNYLKPYRAIQSPRVRNIEFSDIVEQRAVFAAMLGNNTYHMARWRLINPWLYDPDLWTSDAALRFHEAEHEQVTQEHYVYQ